MLLDELEEEFTFEVSGRRELGYLCQEKKHRAEFRPSLPGVAKRHPPSANSLPVVGSHDEFAGRVSALKTNA
jgi:hypothetical protein